jgi:DNA-binding SARP family transcriptional activator/Tfp pilus assembly protein PilF
VRNRKAQAILAMLALGAGPTLSRERLAATLWSESAADQARQSLRQTLLDMKRALGPEGEALLAVTRSELTLRQPLDSDVAALLDAAERDPTPPEGVEWRALPETLLAGLDDLDPAFGDWLAGRRATLLERLAQAMEARLDAAAEAEARGWATALMALDPTHEPACRRLMRADAARGDVRAALKRYAALWDRLDEELGAEPSPETQALAVEFKSLEAPPARPAQRPALTLCVGEFLMNGLDAALGYLVRGFRQDLLATLTPYREWVVIEPGPGGAPAADGVYALEGYAYPARDGVRINVTLKDVAARRFVWGQQEVALALEGWFETCRLTTRRIAAALDVRVTDDRLSRRPGEDVALPLYDKLLLARDLLARWEREADARAQRLLEDVLAQDPGFARAKIGLAQLLCSRHLVTPGAPRVGPADAHVAALAREAAEADPLDAEARLCLGWACAMLERCDPAAEAFVAAAELNPTHPRTLASAADGLALCGRDAEAAALAEASLTLDLGASRRLWGHRGSAWLHMGEFERALEALERADGALPHSVGQHAAALAALGRETEARAAWRRFSEAVSARWEGRGGADDSAVAAWLLASQPVADPARRERFAALIARARGV